MPLVSNCTLRRLLKVVFPDEEGPAFVACDVEVAHGGDAHDFVPTVVFLEHFEHLFLLHHFLQAGRVFPVGHAQEQAVIVFHDVEQADVSRAGHEASVVAIRGIPQAVIECIELVVGAQELGFVHHSPLGEYFRHLAGVAFDAFEGDVGVDDFLHLLLDADYVVQPDGTV